MKYSDHPMPLVEGERPWSLSLMYDQDGTRREVWCQMEDKDIPPDPGPEDRGAYYIESYNEEYWGPETVCKKCGTRFMAYSEDHKKINNFCPGCGERF